MTVVTCYCCGTLDMSHLNVVIPVYINGKKKKLKRKNCNDLASQLIELKGKARDDFMVQSTTTESEGHAL